MDNKEPNKLTPSGWPRPIIGGWPIPWIAEHDNLSAFDRDRMQETILYMKCQVCGLGHESGSRVFACVKVNDSAETSWYTDLSIKDLYLMDNAVMHERCMKLAVGRCPPLSQMKSDNELMILSSLFDDVKLDKNDLTGTINMVFQGSKSTLENAPG